MVIESYIIITSREYTSTFFLIPDESQKRLIIRPMRDLDNDQIGGMSKVFAGIAKCTNRIKGKYNVTLGYSIWRPHPPMEEGNSVTIPVEQTVKSSRKI